MPQSPPSPTLKILKLNKNYRFNYTKNDPIPPQNPLFTLFIEQIGKSTNRPQFYQKYNKLNQNVDLNKSKHVFH